MPCMARTSDLVAKTTKPPVPCDGPDCQWHVLAVGAIVAHHPDTCPDPTPVRID